MYKQKNIFISIVLASILVACSTEPKQEIRYYPDGKIASIIDVLSDSQKSFVRYFFEEGGIKNECYYLKGMLVDTSKTFYSNGVLKSLIFYENDKIEGEAIWFHPNGKIKEKAIFVDGVTQGILEGFTENSNLEFINFFDKGFLHYVKYYRRDSTGDLTSVSENFIPKVSLNRDTIHFGDTLEVLFELNYPGDSTDINELTVKYDFSEDREGIKEGFFYPINELTN